MSAAPTQPEDFASLYRRAFEDFGASALWSSHPVRDPPPADALAITHSLRVEGDMRARRLAERIETACRATCWDTVEHPVSACGPAVRTGLPPFFRAV